MMEAKVGVYSCDDHLDLYAVTPKLWESRLPSALAARGPSFDHVSLPMQDTEAMIAFYR